MSSKQRFLFVAVTAGALAAASCGIDFYVYLEPVPAASYKYLEKVTTFSLPSNQVGGGYFTEYQVFYKIYYSKKDQQTSIDQNLSTELVAIRQELYDDYMRIRPYTTGDKAPTDLASQLERAPRFFKASFADPVLDPLIESPSIQSPLGASAKGDARIDFNMSGQGYGHPILIVNGAPYRLLRDEYIDSRTSKRDFLFSAGLSGGDVTGQSEPYAYVLFYIAASGSADGFSSMYSKPTFLGIFKLP